MDNRLIGYSGFLALNDFLDEKICRKKFGIPMEEDLLAHFGFSDEEQEDVLMHYGTPRHSGRYPWGSGENPYQRYANFTGHVQRMRELGMSNNEIAKSMGMTTTVFRAKLSYAEDETRKAKVAQAQKLRDKGYSLQAVAERMGLPNESSVRSLLNNKAKLRMQNTQATIDALKKAVEENKYVDVGGGTELHLGISATKLKTAVIMLEEQGYKVHPVYQTQQGTGKKTTIKILTKDDVDYKEVLHNKENAAIPGYHSEDGGITMDKIEKPRPVSGDRIAVRYAEEGGKDRDGTIELRRGVDDISLGKALYAQVRVAVKQGKGDEEPSHYLKGMAVYGDDSEFPPGVDIIFNTNKPKGTEVYGKSSDSSVFKPIKAGADPTNPFGATIRTEDDDLIMAQRHYVDKNGERQLSCLNIVNEEGDWGSWSKTLSSQFLSKQRPALIKEKLKEAYDIRREEFDEIMSLDNPVLKAKLAESFAEDCDSAAVHLKGAKMPRQRSQVLLPLTDLKEDECYDPNYKDGEKVVLIRYPHAGLFEIAELTVNNRLEQGKRLLTREDGSEAMDAIGIHPVSFQKLSGADADGDSVLVIPNNEGRIKSLPALEQLRDFSTDQYKLPDDAPPVDSNHGFHKQMEMGKVSNLITDMTLRGAAQGDYDEIARAVRHSMVVIDAEKHHLDWRQSALENDIAALKEKYQGGPDAGASTLISQAQSMVRGLPARRLVTNPKRMTPEERERFYNGEKIYEDTGRTYNKPIRKQIKDPTIMTEEELAAFQKGKKIYRNTGEWKEEKSTTSVSKMEMAFDSGKDAYALSSGTIQEIIYAEHANRLHRLANEARKTAWFSEGFERDPTAASAYKAEVASLEHKLVEAEMNRPLERKAQMLADRWVRAAREADPYMDADDIKKLRGRKITEARLRIGAKKKPIDITEKEWEAIQHRAISKTKLKRILNNADVDQVKALSMPKKTKGLSDAKIARARSMIKNGDRTEDIAEALGVSVSTLQKALYETK